MHNELNAIQIALAGLMGVSILLMIATLINMAFNSPKETERANPLEDLEKTLSDNNISYQQATKKLNDYKS